MVPEEPGNTRDINDSESQAFKEAVIRLKRKQGLYVQETFGTVFLGPSLFRTSIDLPANVPVGPLTARVHLFREGILLDTFQSKVQLAREGVGRYIYDIAMGYPLFYGILTVFISAAAGWIASKSFSRRRS